VRLLVVRSGKKTFVECHYFVKLGAFVSGPLREESLHRVTLLR
jgi:hypothetical protein